MSDAYEALPIERRIAYEANAWRVFSEVGQATKARVFEAGVAHLGRLTVAGAEDCLAAEAQNMSTSGRADFGRVGFGVVDALVGTLYDQVRQAGAEHFDEYRSDEREG